MAVIPLLDGPQVQERLLPDATIGYQASPNQFGAQVGQSIENVGQQTQRLFDNRDREAKRIAEQETQKANQIALGEARNQDGAWEAEAMPAAMATRGKDAFGLPETVVPAYDKNSEKILSGLANEEQKTAYKLYSDAKRNQILETLNTHMGQQHAVVDDEQFKAGLVNSQQLVGVYSNDELRVNQEIQKQIESIDQIAARQGHMPEWIKAQKMQATTASHLTVIGNYLDAENDNAAGAWFKKYQGEIDQQGQHTVTNALEVSGTRAKSQEIVDQIDPSTGLQEGLDKIQQQTSDNPKLREETEQRWVHTVDLRSKAQAQNQDNLFQNAYNTTMAPGNLRGLDAVPAATLSAMSPEKQEWLKAAAKREASGVQPSQDWAVWTKFQSDVATDPTAVGKLSVSDFMMKYRGVLDNEHFDRASSTYGDLRKKGSEGDAMTLASGARSEQQIINGTLEARGLALSGHNAPLPGTQGARDQEVLLSAIDKAISARKVSLQKASGKRVNELPPAELNSIVGDVLKENANTDPGAWHLLWPNRPASDKITGVKTPQERMKTIPDGDLNMILDAFRLKGRTAAPSPQEVLDVYDAAHGR